MDLRTVPSLDRQRPDIDPDAPLLTEDPMEPLSRLAIIAEDAPHPGWLKRISGGVRAVDADVVARLVASTEARIREERAHEAARSVPTVGHFVGVAIYWMATAVYLGDHSGPASTAERWDPRTRGEHLHSREVVQVLIDQRDDHGVDRALGVANGAAGQVEWFVARASIAEVLGSSIYVSGLGLEDMARLGGGGR